MTGSSTASSRASTLKDFMKTGCSYAIVQVELKNIGEDAFKPDVYGDMIIIERRITESDTSTTLKDYHGRKVASRKEELRELVEHFSIDVENPCVVMSQDKSREFLHSGNEKDKFKDAVSRKISLDTLINFALAHGSQWIFITPHDVRVVKPEKRIKEAADGCASFLNRMPFYNSSILQESKLLENSSSLSRPPTHSFCALEWRDPFMASSY